MSDRFPLADIGVLVTRPSEQARHFCERIREAGGNPIAFPTVVIEPLEASASKDTAADGVIVTSSNSVRHGKKIIARLLQQRPRPVVIAIGQGTANALREAGISVDQVPGVAGSEGVLELPVMNRRDLRKVAIVQGENGRQLLQQTLASRGTAVNTFEVYRRAAPEVDTATLLETWRGGGIDVVTAHSRSALENLDKLLDGPGKELLQQARVVVPTSRMITLCRDIGITRDPVVARSAEDHDMLTAVLDACADPPGNRER